MSMTRDVAERVVLDTFTNDSSWTNAELINAVDKALQAERERAARIIKEHREADRCEGSCWEIITIAIREGKPQE